MSRLRNRGFTLVELLVATLLLAIVALLSWRGLDSVLQTRERIVASSDELKALSIALTQIDEDLRKSWPVRLLAPDQIPVRFVMTGETSRGQLELLREAGAQDGASQIQPVVWRLRAGVLERGFGPWRPPDALAKSEGLTWQPLLADVVEVQWQGFVSGQGWADAGLLAARSGEPITGVIIRVVLDQGRQLERVISVSD